MNNPFIVLQKNVVMAKQNVTPQGVQEIDPNRNEKYNVGLSIDLNSEAGILFPYAENVIVNIDDEKQIHAVSMYHGPFGRESVIISSDDYHRWNNGDMVMQDFSEK